MEAHIQTLHPLGKRGRRIDRKKYERVRAVMLAALRGKTLTHSELMAAMKKRLPWPAGTALWYSETVKLDLEARRLIRRKKAKPHNVYVRSQK